MTTLSQENQLKLTRLFSRCMDTRTASACVSALSDPILAKLFARRMGVSTADAAAELILSGLTDETADELKKLLARVLGGSSAAAAVECLTSTVPYVGPFDLVAGTHFGFSHRALSAAKIGSTAYTLRRSSDNQEQSFSYGANGNVDAGVISAFAGAAAYAHTWNDQGSVGCNISKNTQADQMPWIASSQGGTPAFGYRTGTYMCGSSASLLLSQIGATAACTIFYIAKGRVEMISNTVGCSFSGDGVNLRIGANAHFNYYDADAEAGGGYNGLLDDSVYYVIDAAIKLGNNSIKANGVEKGPQFQDEFGSNLGPSSIFPQVGIVAAGGELKEWHVWNGYMSDANRALIRQNMAAWAQISSI